MLDLDKLGRHEVGTQKPSKKTRLMLGEPICPRLGKKSGDNEIGLAVLPRRSPGRTHSAPCFTARWSFREGQVLEEAVEDHEERTSANYPRSATPDPTDVSGESDLALVPGESLGTDRCD